MRRVIHATVVLVCRGEDVALWPLKGPARPDLAVVERLARYQLAARRIGCCVRLDDAGSELRTLLDLTGLLDEMSACEVGREAEGGEQLGVDEVVVPDDPPV